MFILPLRELFTGRCDVQESTVFIFTTMLKDSFSFCCNEFSEILLQWLYLFLGTLTLCGIPDFCNGVDRGGKWDLSVEMLGLRILLS